MGFSKEHREEIKKFIIDTIDMRENPYKKVLEKYPVSRQTVSKYIKGLLEENIIEKSEKNEYQLKFYVNELKKYKNKDLEEDIIYNEFISEYEKDKKENILHILNYTFTEILNNAIEHSSGNEITIFYTEDYKRIFVYIEDNGIGIFRKIKEDHNLENENQAIFELQKGKLTSDAENHSGEGIFFTSKVVDFFQKIENIDNEIKGTSVLFILDKNTERTTFQVFQEYTDDNYIFDKTTITVYLAKEYMGESFMSRSQARRILLNAEKFRIIFLDFSEVDIIGQAFADEIFRVYVNKNPNIQIIPINANAEVDFMIKRSQR